MCSNLLLLDQIVPKFRDLCSYCANKVLLLCVPSLFLKQLKEQKTKTRGTLGVLERHFSSSRLTKNPTLKVSSCKKWPNNTEDKNPIETYSVLTQMALSLLLGNVDDNNNDNDSDNDNDNGNGNDDGNDNDNDSDNDNDDDNNEKKMIKINDTSTHANLIIWHPRSNASVVYLFSFLFMIRLLLYCFALFPLSHLTSINLVHLYLTCYPSVKLLDASITSPGSFDFA